MYLGTRLRRLRRLQEPEPPQTENPQPEGFELTQKWPRQGYDSYRSGRFPLLIITNQRVAAGLQPCKDQDQRRADEGATSEAQRIPPTERLEAT